MALRPGPLPGYYVEAITGIMKDSTAQSPSDTTNERCYIKDCVASWLGLKIATPRTGQFQAGATPNPNQTNQGRSYAIRGQRGSYQYKILLIPATPIPVSYYDRTTGTLKSETVPRNSVSISLSRTISVAELRAWLILKVGAGDTGTIKADASNAIMGLVTPWDRKYIWRTPLIPTPDLSATPNSVYIGVESAGGVP
ncbi:hypothetical protein [Laspinema palackyanum]|uniref:hypothetical protein n=1 Tax=Laspinema palackyanum TaxID=3231601 RepID=UPI00345D4ECE|nr:hypothetical protein [Laspinema sp. D2c]